MVGNGSFRSAEELRVPLRREQRSVLYSSEPLLLIRLENICRLAAFMLQPDADRVGFILLLRRDHPHIETDGYRPHFTGFGFLVVNTG